MPFPFVLSTTSHFTFQSCFTSSTHPSLPSTITSARAILRSNLKDYKRSTSQDQANRLNHVLQALNNYLRYLLTLDYALSGKQVAGEDIDIALVKEVELEWRSILGQNTIPGRENDRIKGRGLDFEVYFVLQTLTAIQNLFARQSLLILYSTPTNRIDHILNATKCLKIAYSIHSYLHQRSNTSPDGPVSFPSNAVDIYSPVQLALQHITHAEINLLGVLKDDPYPGILIQSRNKEDREWMVKAPEIPKMRVQVLRRLCIGAAENAAKSVSILKHESRKVSKGFIDYCEDIQITARAKACRFSAIDLDNVGETGKAIAWLRAGMNELGIQSKNGRSGINKIKTSWDERKEDKRIEKRTSSWGIDGGKLEEGRILEYLDLKMSKMNDTVNVQSIPDWKHFLSTLPSGMNIPIEDHWIPVTIEEDELTRMRAPPENEGYRDESTDDDDFQTSPVGAFPGTSQEYGKSGGISYF